MADDQAKLFGTWCSPFSCRVTWALKLKGISYDHIEEDLPFKKSAELVKYNPVHKKIPVFLHGDKSICESMVIVEYIEETWPQTYPLLPADPHERAVARFWVKFADDTAPSIWWVFRTTGEEQEKAMKESLEMLRTIEDHAGLDKKKFFGGEKIGIVDLAFGQVAQWFGVIEEVVGVLELLEAHTFPHLYAWTKNFKEVPSIKENLPDHDRMVAFYKPLRESLLASIRDT